MLKKNFKQNVSLLFKLTFYFGFLAKDLAVMVDMSKLASLLSLRISVNYYHIMIARY